MQSYYFSFLLFFFFWGGVVGMVLARILQLYANLKCINSPINDSAKKTHNNYTVFPSFISRGRALVWRQVLSTISFVHLVQPFVLPWFESNQGFEGKCLPPIALFFHQCVVNPQAHPPSILVEGRSVIWAIALRKWTVFQLRHLFQIQATCCQIKLHNNGNKEAKSFVAQLAPPSVSNGVMQDSNPPPQLLMYPYTKKQKQNKTND